MDPRDIHVVGRIYKGDHHTLLNAKYESSGPRSFREEDLFNFFPIVHVSLWEISAAMETKILMQSDSKKGTSRQRSGKGAIRKRFPLQKPRWEKTKLTIRYLYHETYRKPNEQLFSQ